MGGGDLNLKKSWHPNTMKNQEKVWKAEQAKTQEERKLNDLYKEIEEEKNREELKRIGRQNGVLGGSSENDKKLDWMYKSSSELINRDEYLLGRKIDKSFEILQDEENDRAQQNLVGVKQPLNHVEHECVPFSIRTYKNLENPEQVDLQRKVMEDPLMLIKQREMETRRKILENPVKLKELHRILKTDEKLQRVSKKSKRVKKSKSKHKKRTKSSSSSSSSSSCDPNSDLDTKLARKLKNGILNNNEASSLGFNLTKLLDTKFEKISQELDKAAGKSKKHSRKNKSKSSDSDASHNSDKRYNYVGERFRSPSKEKRFESGLRNKKRSINYEERRYRHSGTRTFLDKKQNYVCKPTSKSGDYVSNRFSKSDSITSKEKAKEGRSLSQVNKNIESSRSEELRGWEKSSSHSKFRNRAKSFRSRSNSPAKSLPKTRYDSQSKKAHPTAKRSIKLTDKEKQAKLKEMMSNAIWREEERTEVVRKHRESYAREEETHTAREFDRNFLNKEVKKAIANQTSVGSRIRANLNNIQRTSSAMNSNFAKK